MFKIRFVEEKALMAGVVIFGLMLLGAVGPVRSDDSGVSESLRLEAKAGIRRGLKYLKGKQKKNGSWRDHPAITGLVATAMLRSGRKEFGVKSKTVKKALNYIREKCKDNGGIYDEFYASYSTSICVVALQEADLPKDQERIAAARRFLLDAQADESEDIGKEDPQYGGWGYEKQGDSPKMHRADMSNTQFALTALHVLEEAWRKKQKKSAIAEKKSKGELPKGPCRRETQLAYDKAIKYLKRCQNKDGGFIYRPDESKAGKTETGGLRSYGSITYAGLKSLIYARVKRSDPRVQKAFEWVSRNWTLHKNPGVGQQGLYYYFQAIGKCLDAYGQNTLVDAGGDEHKWRTELVDRLLELQRENGSWKNDKSGRWMEKIPELVTAYSLMAMEEAIDLQ